MHRENILINGVIAPSVTQVLSVVNKPFLLLWYGKHGTAKCEQIKQESIDIGHAFHDAIEGYFRGDTAQELREDVARMFSLVKGWAVETKFSPRELELSMQSSKHGFHGTCDAIGTFEDGQLIVLDWKTSSSVDPLHAVQLSAYAQMYQEMTGEVITDGLIVRVDKKENAKVPLEIRRFTDLPRYFSVFLSCLDLWRFMNQKKGKL